jgi:vacuolar-type H+-ATPase subunit E/Vma4
VAARNAAIERSRAEGLAAAEHDAQLAAATARRAVRSRTLAAQRAVYDDLRDAVETAVAGLRDDPGYGSLLDGWTEIALAQIGREATVVRDPLPDGGIIATLGDRRVAYTLTALAEIQIASLADKVGALWE